jgi:hypothetical protein
MEEPSTNDNDRYKTGCVGILLPLVGAAYGILIIACQKTSGIRGLSPVVGPGAVEVGIGILGVALFTHTWGFEPYRRHPIIRGILTITSVAMFLKGVIHGI